MHLRICRADWLGRLKAGKPHSGWLDDDDRQAILALPAIQEHAADLPATPDFQSRHQDIPVTALNAAALEPGAYWVIASPKPGFAEADNIVSTTMVWVTQLAIVTEQQRQAFASARKGGLAPEGRRRTAQGSAPLGGHVVDLATGEPVPDASVKLFLRAEQGKRQGFAERATVTTDEQGRFEFESPQGRELVLAATATTAGRSQTATSDPLNFWQNETPTAIKTIVLVTDRGIHRPGQIVFYKGIACAGDLQSA